MLTTHKITRSSKPEYLANRLRLKTPNNANIFPLRQAYTIPLVGNLTTTRGGFCYRAANLYNILPIHLRSCDHHPLFKREVKKWVKSNVPVKPP